MKEKDAAIDALKAIEKDAQRKRKEKCETIKKSIRKIQKKNSLEYPESQCCVLIGEECPLLGECGFIEGLWL